MGCGDGLWEPDHVFIVFDEKGGCLNVDVHYTLHTTHIKRNRSERPQSTRGRYNLTGETDHDLSPPCGCRRSIMFFFLSLSLVDGTRPHADEKNRRI